jgi:hypothetical protein
MREAKNQITGIFFSIPILIIILITVLIIITACSSKKEVRREYEELIQNSPQEALPKEISSGRLVEVYEEYINLNKGERKENWIIIKNVKETQEFRIIPCSGCVFEQERLEIPSDEYRMVKFYVEAEEGEKQIRVKDSNNNAYGYAKISVIVE